MKYQVWVIARDPKTLQPIAEVLVFEHDVRLKAEAYNEEFTDLQAKIHFLFGVVVTSQNPLYSTETRIPGWGVVAPRLQGDPPGADRVTPRDPGAKGDAVIPPLENKTFAFREGAGGGALRGTFTYNFPNTAGAGGAGGGGKACQHCGIANSLHNTRCTLCGGPM